MNGSVLAICLGLIGGLCSGPTNFLLPMLFYLGALARSPPPGAAAPPSLWGRLVLAARRELPPTERAALLLISGFILLTMVLGTYSVAADIARRWDTLGGPFACHALALVNSSDPCSANV